MDVLRAASARLPTVATDDAVPALSTAAQARIHDERSAVSNTYEMKTYRNNFGANHKGGGIGKKLKRFRWNILAASFDVRTRTPKPEKWVSPSAWTDIHTEYELAAWRDIEDSMTRVKNVLLKQGKYIEA